MITASFTYRFYSDTDRWTESPLMREVTVKGIS